MQIPNINTLLFIHQAPVVQKLDNAIHRINRYPEDRYYENQLRYPWIVIYPLDSDYPPFEQLGPGSSKVDINFASANTS